MTNATGIGLDPSVCYRHPDRQSWDLCQRCGRTVCPECQVAVPAGVQCPDCIRETGGGKSWQPAHPRRAPAKRLPSARARRVRALVATDAAAPVGTRSILGASIVLWLAGFALDNLPFQLLAALPGAEWQLWRFLTAPLVTPSLLAFGPLLSFVLNGVFFFLTGPQLERMLGTRRFLAVVLASSVLGTAFMLLAGGYAFGLTAPLFGLFGALLVVVWSDQRTRTRILIMIGINLVLDIVASNGSGLPLLIGGMIGGAGTVWLLSSAGDRGWKPRTAPLILWGSVAGFALLAVLKGLVAA